MNLPLVLPTIAASECSNPQTNSLRVQTVIKLLIFDVEESARSSERNAPGCATVGNLRLWYPGEHVIAIEGLLGLEQILLERTMRDPILVTFPRDDPLLSYLVVRYMAAIGVVFCRTDHKSVDLTISDLHTSHWN